MSPGKILLHLSPGGYDTRGPHCKTLDVSVAFAMESGSTVVIDEGDSVCLIYQTGKAL